MDNFMDKLAQKYNAQEMIKANTAAEEKELEKRRMEAEEYKAYLQQMKELNRENTELAEKIGKMMVQLQQATELNQAKMDEIVESHANSKVSLEEITKKNMDFQASLEEIAKKNTEYQMSLEELAKANSSNQMYMEQIAKANSFNQTYMEQIAKDHADSQVRMEHLVKSSEENMARIANESVAKMNRVTEDSVAKVSRIADEGVKTVAEIATINQDKLEQMQVASNVPIQAEVDLSQVEKNIVLMTQALEEEKKKLAELFEQTNEYVHRENVKVYRNVQAVVVEEVKNRSEEITRHIDEQNNEMLERLEAVENSANTIKPSLKVAVTFSVITAVAALGGLTLYILTYLNII